MEGSPVDITTWVTDVTTENSKSLSLVNPDPPEMADVASISDKSVLSHTMSLSRIKSLGRKRTLSKKAMTGTLRTAAGNLAGYDGKGDIVLLPESPVTSLWETQRSMTDASLLFPEPTIPAPSPANPSPANSSPSNPSPANSSPSNPSPANSSPTSSSPTEQGLLYEVRTRPTTWFKDPVKRNSLVILLIQVIVCISLEVVIMTLHLQMVNVLIGFLGTWNIQQGIVPGAQALVAYHGLFILGQVWMIFLWINAVRSNSGTAAMALFLFNLYLFAFSIVQMWMSYTMLTPEQLQQIYQAGVANFHYHASLPYEWAVVTICFVCIFAWAWACHKMYKTFGWTVYRYNGADVVRRDKVKARHLVRTLMDVLLYLLIGFCLQWILLEMDQNTPFAETRNVIMSFVELSLSLLIMVFGYLGTLDKVWCFGKRQDMMPTFTRVPIEANGDVVQGIQRLDTPTDPVRPTLLTIFLLGLCFIFGYQIFVLAQLYSVPPDRFQVARYILTFWVASTTVIVIPLFFFTIITLRDYLKRK